MNKKSKIIGSLWIFLGTVAAPWAAYDLIRIALRPEYGYSSNFYEPSWWIIQSLFPFYFAAIFTVGLGLLGSRQWAFLFFKILSPIMFLYLISYVILGGAESWLWWFIGLAGAVLGGFSMVFAYSKRIQIT